MLNTTAAILLRHFLSLRIFIFPFAPFVSLFMERDFGICNVVAILVFLKFVKAQLLMNIQHNNNHGNLLLCPKLNPLQLSMSDACMVVVLFLPS